MSKRKLMFASCAMTVMGLVFLFRAISIYPGFGTALRSMLSERGALLILGCFGYYECRVRRAAPMTENRRKLFLYGSGILSVMFLYSFVRFIIRSTARMDLDFGEFIFYVLGGAFLLLTAAIVCAFFHFAAMKKEVSRAVRTTCLAVWGLTAFPAAVKFLADNDLEPGTLMAAVVLVVIAVLLIFGGDRKTGAYGGEYDPAPLSSSGTEQLRRDLMDYYGTAAYNASPVAAMDVLQVEQMNAQELMAKAKEANIDLSKYR